jgi:hypothetical protein
MSIVLVGSTSGSITLQEPAVAGTTVLTLPAVTGNVLTDTSPKAGNVIQVVQATTSTTVSVTTGGYTDTGLTATITPTSSSSKILVLVNQSIAISGGANSQYGGMKLLRGATSILDPVESGGSPYEFGLATYGNQGMYNRLSINYLDSPATTSATTYKTQGRPYVTTSSGTMAFQISGSPNGTSTIILMEIAA